MEDRLCWLLYMQYLRNYMRTNSSNLTHVVMYGEYQRLSSGPGTRRYQ